MTTEFHPVCLLSTWTCWVLHRRVTAVLGTVTRRVLSAICWKINRNKHYVNIFFSSFILCQHNTCSGWSRMCSYLISLGHWNKPGGESITELLFGTCYYCFTHVKLTNLCGLTHSTIVAVPLDVTVMSKGPVDSHNAPYSMTLLQPGPVVNSLVSWQ